VEPVPDSRNFNLKKQVELTTVLTKELESTIEKVEFWQENYEEAVKTIQKLKSHYPQGVETHSDEETEEFTLASPPHKMATRAPPFYVMPNNDDD
jgi:gas vesicle protein